MRDLGVYIGSPPCLLEVQSKVLQPNDGRHKLFLIALDALDGDDALGELVGVLRLGGFGLGGLLLSVPSGALLGVDGEGCGSCFESLCRKRVEIVSGLLL